MLVVSNPRFEYFEKEKPYPREDYVRVDHGELQNFVTTVFEKLGVRREYAEVVADVLVTADLMGISSHGVQRLKRYIEGVKRGFINPNAEPSVVSEVGAVVVLDAHRGFGHVAGVKAVEYAVERAQYYGVGVVLVRNSTHYGIAGYYALKIVEKSYIGLSTTNSRPLVAYTNTLDKNIGTNPIAIGIPRKNPPPILYDAALSVVPVGKIELYSKTNTRIPPGWVVDLATGSMLEGDAMHILEKISKGEAAILPLGGLSEETGGHKGSGLLFLVDVFTGVLSGSGYGKHAGSEESGVAHLFMAIDIDCFANREVFYEKLEDYIAMIKSSRKHPGADNVWIPGEKSWLTMQTRMEIGIPVHKSVLHELDSIAEELCIPKLKRKTQV